MFVGQLKGYLVGQISRCGRPNTTISIGWPTTCRPLPKNLCQVLAILFIVGVHVCVCGGGGGGVKVNA